MLDYQVIVQNYNFLNIFTFLDILLFMYMTAVVILTEL